MEEFRHCTQDRLNREVQYGIQDSVWAKIQKELRIQVVSLANHLAADYFGDHKWNLLLQWKLFKFTGKTDALDTTGGAIRFLCVTQ